MTMTRIIHVRKCYLVRAKEMTQMASSLKEILLWRKPSLTFPTIACGSLIYYHCTVRNSSLVSLASDAVLVLVSSLAVLGMLFRNYSIPIPVDPLEWQVSQESATSIAACIANTVGAAEGVLRVAASGSDYKLFFKVVVSLYLVAAIGRVASGATIAYSAFLASFVVPFLVTKVKPHALSFVTANDNKIM